MPGSAESLGELATAEACHRRAQSAQPGSTAPLARLATLLRGKPPDADRQAIQARLDESRSADNARDWRRGDAPLLHGMASVLDARGEYAGAASCLSEANASALEQRHHLGRVYHRREHSARAGAVETVRRAAGRLVRPAAVVASRIFSR